MPEHAKRASASRRVLRHQSAPTAPAWRGLAASQDDAAAATGSPCSPCSPGSPRWVTPQPVVLQTSSTQCGSAFRTNSANHGPGYGPGSSSWCCPARAPRIAWLPRGLLQPVQQRAAATGARPAAMAQIGAARGKAGPRGPAEARRRPGEDDRHVKHVIQG